MSVDPRLAELYKTRETADALALAMSEQSKAVLWLREQFKRGALPPDPDFVEALLARATGDPDLVLRLQRETLAAEGSHEFCRTRSRLTFVPHIEDMSPTVSDILSLC